jgi:hypothetical protein
VSDFVPSPDVPALVPAALRDGPYQAVRAAWIAGCRAHDAQHPPLRTALERLARAARAGEIPILQVLRTLDAVCRSDAGGDGALDWDHVRPWAGGVVIRAYYRDD